MERDNEKERDEFLKKIDQIEHSLELENKKLKKISLVEGYLTTIKESVGKCSELLSKSLENGPERDKFNNLLVEGNSNYIKAFDSFQEYSIVVKKKVDNLNAERENIILEFERNGSEKE